MRRLIALSLLVLLAGCTGSQQNASQSTPGEVLDVRHVQPRDTTHEDEGFSMSWTEGTARLEVYAGKRPTGGYGVTIREVRRVEDTVIVDAAVTTPPEDAVVTQAFTYPADAVTFPLEQGAYRVRLRMAEGDATRTTERTVVLR